MEKYKYILLLVVTIFCLHVTPVSAQTILYIPADDRPVNLEYVIDTAKSAGIEIVTPPPALIGSLSNKGNADQLWTWLFDHANTADSVVVAADSLLYGNLITSRTHKLPLEVIEERIDNFTKLKSLNPKMKLYIYSTIMRTPQSGEGDEEPAYYKQYGPSIFRITALRDQAEMQQLSTSQNNELRDLVSRVPHPILTDWYARREKNLIANKRLIDYAKKNTFTYFLLGRDDCAPYSQSHMESRHLATETIDLPTERYASFPGVDELGMLMVTRAVNNAANRTPTIRVLFASGSGPSTIPSYEDVAVGQTIDAHIVAAGGIPVDSEQADLVLAVNTPGDGITREAESNFNRGQFRTAPVVLAWDIGHEVKAGHRVAVADIAYGNGADNTLMAELSKRGLLFKLEAYSGWNTASNTIGYAIGQGILASQMTAEAKNRLLAIRFLDDWGYQANVRDTIGREVLSPLGGSWFFFGNLTARMTAETNWRLRTFAANNFPEYPLKKFTVSFPLNRMFEVEIKLQ